MISIFNKKWIDSAPVPELPIPEVQIFSTPEEQIAIMRELNRKLQWKFPKDEFDRARKSVPSYFRTSGKGILAAPVLVPYLSTFARTTSVLLDLLEDEYELNVPPEFDPSNPERMRFSYPGKSVSKLGWIALDFEWGVSKSMEGTRALTAPRPEIMPHLFHVLAAALMHPQWLAHLGEEVVPVEKAVGYRGLLGSMLTKKRQKLMIPNLIIGGTEFRSSSDQPWSPLYLYRDRKEGLKGEIMISGITLQNFRNSCSSVAKFCHRREESPSGRA